jgi:integrase
MGWIKKTRAGTWKASWRDPEGKICYRTFKRKLYAERFLSTTEADLLRGSYVDPTLGRMRVRDWAQEWWPTTLHLRPSSRARSEGILQTRLLPRFGSRRLESLRSTDVRAFVAELSEEGLSAGSVRKIYNVLRAMLRAAVEADVIGRSPCLGVDLPPLTRLEMRFLEAVELERLAQAINERYAALILTAGYTGLRWGELAGLKRQRLNILHRRIEVVETMVEISGTLVTGPPKTGERSVTLTERLAEILDEHIARYRDRERYVFGAPGGGPIRRNNFMKRHFHKAVERAGLSPMRFHDLRHTAAALAIAAGAHPLEIKTRLGHSSIQTTLNVYGHLFKSLDERLARTLDAAHREAEREAGSSLGERVGMSLPEAGRPQNPQHL